MANNKIIKERNLAHISFYSFLLNCGKYFFSIIVTFIFARFFTPHEWGILILAQSIIFIWILITDFFPPGLNYALDYYVPNYISLNKYSSLRLLIFNSIKSKLIILIPSYIIGLILVISLPLFDIEIKLIILVLSPLIFLESLNRILSSICYGYKLYRTLFFIVLIQYGIYIGFLFILGITANFNLIIVSIILTISVIVGFLLKIAILIKRYVILVKNTNKIKEYRQYLRNVSTYGAPVFIAGQVNSLWREFKKQIIGYLTYPTIVTYYNIGENISMIPLTISLSFNQPVITHFSGLDTNESEKVGIQFVFLFKAILILTCFITGWVFFLLYFLTIFIYGQDYLKNIPYLELILLSSIPRVLGGLVTAILSARKKVKIFPLLALIFNGILIVSFFIGFINFGLYGYAFSLIIAYFLIFSIQIWLMKKIANIAIQVKNTVLIIISFFSSIFITKLIIMNFIDNLLIDTIFGLFSFSLLFLIQLKIFKTISIDDISFLKMQFKEKNWHQNMIRKVLKISEKLVN